MPTVTATKTDSADDRKKEKAALYCISPEFRVSYPHLFTPYQGPDQVRDGKEGKYSLTMLFAPGTDLKGMQRAMNTALVKTWGKDPAKWPKNLRKPFHKGEEKEGTAGYEPGIIYVAASSKTRPGVIDQRKSPIVEADNSLYAGCYARASLIAYTYDTAGNRGVNFALQNVQKTRDGEPFSGRKKAEDEFDEVETDGDGFSASSEDDASGDDDFLNA